MPWVRPCARLGKRGETGKSCAPLRSTVVRVFESRATYSATIGINDCGRERDFFYFLFSQTWIVADKQKGEMYVEET